MVIPGAIFSLQAVWNLSGIMNALMAVPNLIALVALNKVTKYKTIEFTQLVKNENKKKSSQFTDEFEKQNPYQIDQSGGLSEPLTHMVYYEYPSHVWFQCVNLF